MTPDFGQGVYVARVLRRGNVLIFEKIRSKINDTNSFFFFIMNFALFRLNSNSIFTFQMRLEILDAGCVSNILIFPRNGEFD